MKITNILLIMFSALAESTNLNYVNYINSKNLSWNLEENKFSNINSKHFKKYKGYIYASPEKATQKHSELSEELPTNFDWREYGIVGDVKNQEQCGSCWAFSAVGALESQLSLKFNTNYILSEQEIVDCVKDVRIGRIVKCCNGCEGGEMSAVYKYLQNKEDDLESTYPYTASDGVCKEKPSTVPYNVTDYVALDSNDEDGLMASLYKIGPISIGVNANRDWQLYQKGIYDPSSTQCPNSMTDMDHGVVLVGFGEENGKKYWTIRNSWGTDWGENGYIRISRGKNTCGVSNTPIYPIVS